MNEQVLSIEQCKELIAMGIDMSDASMVWFPTMEWDKETNNIYVKEHYLVVRHNVPKSYWNTREGKETYLTYTLYDLLNKLPKIPHYYYPDLRQVTNLQWQIIYKPQLGELQWLDGWGKTSIECAFNMLKYCKEHELM